MSKTTPYDISKHVVLEEFQRVKSNGGTAEVDGVSLETVESKLNDNLYKIWNRMSSESCFPPPVKAIEIPENWEAGAFLECPRWRTVFKKSTQKCFQPFANRSFSTVPLVADLNEDGIRRLLP